MKDAIKKCIRAAVERAADDLVTQYRKTASVMVVDRIANTGSGVKDMIGLLHSACNRIANTLSGDIVSKLSLTNNTLERIADTISDATEVQRAMAIESRFMPAVQEELAQTIERSEPKSKRATTKKKTTKRSKKK